jgi:hypothetical protein
MLNAAEKNLGKEPSRIRNKILLSQADARAFDLNKEFGLVYFPSHSFDHIVNKIDQIRTLEAIKRHIAPGGVYAFDLVHIPKIKEDNGWFVQSRPLGEVLTVVRLGYQKIDSKKCIMNIHIWYEVYENGRMLERYYEENQVFIHSVKGIRKLLKETGYEIIDWYGSYDRQTFTLESDMMLIVSKPKT